MGQRESSEVVINLTSPFNKSPQFTPASISPSRGEQYELHLDSYLPQYLNECPNAGNEPERELASMACSAYIHLEEGRALVSLAQPGAADEVRSCKAEADKLFENEDFYFKTPAILCTIDEYLY